MTREEIEERLREIDGVLVDETISPLTLLELGVEREYLQGLLDDMEQAS